MLLLTSGWCILFLSACAHRILQQPGHLVEDEPVAFPGAEGFGKYTNGGRGGKVVIVSNLNDAGEGSLRAAVSRKFPRIIVFSISGTIHLLSELKIASDVTIAGQTAPGDGICLADYPVSLSGNNIILRYMRFRMGDRYQNRGMVNGAGADDAFGGLRRKNIMIDHCTMSWSTDEACSVYAGDSTTLQWNLISEPLNYSYHFETGDKDFEHHGYGGIIGGLHTSFHHNLYAHCGSRTPRFNGIRHTATEMVDFENNVIYNWASNNVYGGEGGSYNIVNNYYKFGPSTGSTVKSRVVNPYKTNSIPYGQYYLQGNHVDGSPEVSNNNWLGVTMNGGTRADTATSKMASPFSAVKIASQKAADAYDIVLKGAGACYPKRDTLDERVIQDVKNRTGKLIDVQGGYPHGTAYELTATAWPALQSAPAPVDTDNDGMPDAWEKANGLNAAAYDANDHKLHTHYDNVEMYFNSLVK